MSQTQVVEPSEVRRKRELADEIKRLDAEGAEIGKRYAELRRKHFRMLNGRLTFLVEELDEEHKRKLESDIVAIQRERQSWQAKWNKVLAEWATVAP
jgi:hypothetical protein